MKYSVLAALLVSLAPSPRTDASFSSPSLQESKSDAGELWRAALSLQRNQRILSQKELQAALAPHLPAIHACYLRHTKRDNVTDGTLFLELLINPEGKVHWMWARARGAQAKELNKCLRKLSAQWVFPKRPGFTNAVVPLVIPPKKDKRRRPI